MRKKGDREQAFENYRTGMIHRLNAETQGVSESTVKSWCLRYKWKERVMALESVHLFMRRLHKMDA